MQSRVALARALAPQPDLLLLDEALSALDVGLKAEMYRLLMAQQQARHCAVLLITHDLMEAVQLADRIVVMGGTPGTLLSEHLLTTARAQRDLTWVFARTAAFMQAPDIQQAFALPAAS
jgi:NitT/TauT family transport system ATP-binding protein